MKSQIQKHLDEIDRLCKEIESLTSKKRDETSPHWLCTALFIILWLVTIVIAVIV